MPRRDRGASATDPRKSVADTKQQWPSPTDARLPGILKRCLRLRFRRSVSLEGGFKAPRG